MVTTEKGIPMKKYKWYNPETGEEALSDHNSVEIQYNESKDESILYIGGTNISFCTVAGEVDYGLAKEISKENGWKVKDNGSE